MRPSRNAVVDGFPRSWHNAPSITDRLPRPVEIVDALARFVDDEQGVHPDVTFGVPLGFLLASDERLELGKQSLDHAELQRELQPDRRLRSLEQQLFEFSPDALSREVIEIEAAADVARAGLEVEVEARGKLQRAQHPERVVAEGDGIHRAENTGRPDRPVRSRGRGTRR